MILSKSGFAPTVASWKSSFRSNLNIFVWIDGVFFHLAYSKVLRLFPVLSFYSVMIFHSIPQTRSIPSRTAILFALPSTQTSKSIIIVVLPIYPYNSILNTFPLEAPTTEGHLVLSKSLLFRAHVKIIRLQHIYISPWLICVLLCFSVQLLLRHYASCFSCTKLFLTLRQSFFFVPD